MADFVIIVGFCLLALGLLGGIFVIPKLVILSTESENDPDHIYTIFMQEIGCRGHKAISAAGCLFPFIMVTRPSFEMEGIAFTGIICVVCAFYHSTVYRGYPVLTLPIKFGMAVLFIFCAGISFLTKFGFIPSGAYIFLLIGSGLLWGTYAVYKRSELIRITRRSSKDGPTPAA